ncbi:hypothetical protein M422DRAFT_275738 [Sphaerobolus stellatus SS14]|uniref:Uncharacterized protein n=1 Tax=Sphaerobolus stellatus (strain SS14) TaxID=990650 RepID=A0A0C9UEI7_SPHS4|nr:hypothetical protein M422DRAFT_275738 [Sphaerobolus stellatus SS14]
MSLRGFTVPPDIVYEKQVKEVVYAKIKNSSVFTGFIHKYHDNIPPHPIENSDVSTHAINHILSSINVKLLKIIINGLDAAIFNISMLRNNVYMMTEGAGSPPSYLRLAPITI